MPNTIFQNPQSTQAWQKLEKLAETPFDLTANNALSAQRITKMKSSALEFDLLYGTQRITDTVLEAFQQLADETQAINQFGKVLNGDIMNKIEGYDSEQRQVLHSACRNVFDDLTSVHDAGQKEATDQSKTQLQKLKSFLEELDKGEITNAKGESFTDMIQIGIGGSDLGPRAIYLALRPYSQSGRRVHFISNVDPDDAAQVLSEVDLSRTLINVVSKSGSTLETRANEALVVEQFVKAGLDPKTHFVSVTGKDSPMDNPEKYLRSFHMYDYIGGRYSATSMVGGVILGFALGYDGFLEILRGAREMDLNALETDIKNNLSLLNALIGIWNHNFLGYETVAVLPYSQALMRFSAHLQQLDMESNGKRINRQGQAVDYQTGPIVWGEPGTNGQHAFYQLIHQSPTIIPSEFIGFRQSQYNRDLEIDGTSSHQKLLANLFAQSVALATGKTDNNPNKVFPGNRPNTVLIADKLTPYTMGALLACYENKVAFQGFIWNINSFDQEGVQLGKVLADRNIDYFKGATSEQETPIGWELLKTAGL